MSTAETVQPVGRRVHRFLADNGLEQYLATNDRSLREAIAAAGRLDAMPEELACAILRGFKIHELLYVITATRPTPWTSWHSRRSAWRSCSSPASAWGCPR